jgi:hypothetical protein
MRAGFVAVNRAVKERNIFSSETTCETEFKTVSLPAKVLENCSSYKNLADLLQITARFSGFYSHGVL